ncbi:MAG: protein-disulfide reductase DsbD domain-containing protein, partial [Pseudomonadota bacterium]
LAGTAAAQALIEAEHVSAEFVVQNRVTAPGETTGVAIVNSLAEGWHTYWINPGDSGEPPIIDLELAGGGTQGETRFPAPERLPYPPLMNFGYKDTFTLLTDVTVPADWPAGTPYRVPVRMDWLVCEAICIPEGGSGEIVIDTAAVSAPDSAVAFTFVRAGLSMPKAAPGEAVYRREGDRLVLDVSFGTPEGAAFFPLERGLIDNAAAQFGAAAGDGFSLSLASGKGRIEGAMKGVLRTDDGAWWLTATGPADPPAAASAEPAVRDGTAAQAAGPAVIVGAAQAPQVGLLQALLFAFVGGLILNLMPCVFPVLALKVFGLIAHADAPFAKRAVIGGAYASGVLTAFAVLAAALLTLKSAGVAVGWGFQLQTPAVVAAMAAVVLLVGLNLAGVFEVGTSLTRVGGTGGDGTAGAFGTGVLATIVATPCTAPFMAVAIGAALAASPQMALGVFFALGAGLATPFVVLTLLPGLAKVLPKPGAWMVRLKQFLAFPMFATLAWLVFVLAQLVGPDVLLGALLGLVMIALAAWFFGLAQMGSTRTRRLTASLAGGSLAIALIAAWPAISGSAPTPVQPAYAAGAGEPFSLSRVAELEADGTPAFVNVTAAWCITCKVNERVVFGGDSFADVLSRTGTRYLVADWTRRDPDVSAFLERFGRAGVPLYVHFKGNGEAEVLPQVLTLSMLEQAFQER